jgi:hypothetical protein
MTQELSDPTRSHQPIFNKSPNVYTGPAARARLKTMILQQCNWPAQAADADSDASPAYAYSAPADLGASCPITKDEFKDWFLDHEITKDGIVTPADSLKKLKTSCDFYAWSWRMFLWLMSNSNDGLVFNTAPFFDLNEDNELVSGGPKKHHVRGGKREGV